jgi:hypothetical protein
MVDENITSTILVVRLGITPAAREVNYLLKFDKKKIFLILGYNQ